MNKKTVFTEMSLGCFPKTYKRSFEDMPWDMDNILSVVTWRTGKEERRMGNAIYCPFESITIDDSRMFRCYSN